MKFSKQDTGEAPFWQAEFPPAPYINSYYYVFQADKHYTLRNDYFSPIENL